MTSNSFIPPGDIVPHVNLAGIDPANLSPQELHRLVALSRRLNENFSTQKLDYLFPATGPYARSGYPKHLTFFRLGASYPERCFMAANRTGKTTAGAFETALHLTGLYPNWWEGKRFADPIKAWVAGGTKEDTRDILQKELLGEVATMPFSARKRVSGTGTVPARLIEAGRITWKQGVQDAVDTVRVKHVTGGWSELGFKSYQQGRRAFQGVKRDVIWLDEECPEDVYEECLYRTAMTDGFVMITFTPLMGLTRLVMSFLPKDYHKLKAE